MFKIAPLVLCVLFPIASVASAASTTQTHSPEATTGATSVPSTLTASQKSQAAEQYGQIQELAALGRHCSWLSPIEQEAVSISADERLAWLAWQHVDLPTIREGADARVKQADTANCKLLTDKRKAVKFGAWQMRSSWALRGYSMLPLKTHPAWFAGKSTVHSHRKALETAFEKLMAYSAKSVSASIAMFDQATPVLLSVRCRSNDRGCPAAVKDPAERIYAETVVKLTERYAVALEKSDDKAGIPSELLTP